EESVSTDECNDIVSNVNTGFLLAVEFVKDLTSVTFHFKGLQA
ncbi:Uncharacterized protein APZ42_008600, partial [Daphnia magna]